MITIVTDSTSNMSEKTAVSLGISVIPMSYTVSGRIYNETAGDNNELLCNLSSQNIMQSSTSQISVCSFQNAFKQLIDKGHEVLCIVISSRLSGTYSSACIAAKQFPEGKIAVVDSLTTAGGLYFLIEKAAQLAAQGLNLNEIASEINVLRNKVGIVFSVENMDNLRRSGRIGVVRQSVGNILNIRPILMLKDGAVVSSALARGKNEQIKELVQRVPEKTKKLIVHYVSNSDMYKNLLIETRTAFPEADIFIHRLGPVLAIHLGLNVLGIAWSEI